MATQTRQDFWPRLLGIMFATTALAAGVARGQAPEGATTYAPVRLPGQPAPKNPGEISTSVTKCDTCHTEYKQPNTPGGRALKSNEFILHNESSTWFKSDVHSIAFANLDGPIGKQMSERLGYKVTEAPQCLTCHSADKTPNKPLADKKPDDFAREDGGVNCTVCHGMGNAWQGEHTDPPATRWREKEPQFKFDKGMADLRNPAVKAKLCVSCHVGNPDEGKVITHDMYAAGHPPIPPFEITNYMASEPKHWGYPSELPYFKQFAEQTKSDEAATWKTFRYFPAEKESYLARHLAAGAVAAMEAEAALLADAAKHSASGFDYARFDCYSCHHDLSYPSARQKRGYEGAPGRVPLKVWNGAVPEALAQHLGGSSVPELKTWADSYKGTWPTLRKAAIARQLGDPAQVMTAAAATRKWCNDYLQLQTVTDKPIYPPSQAKELLKIINTAATSDKWTGAPEAVMALTWASLGLRNDLKSTPPQDQLASLGRVIITQVRSEPFSTPDKLPVPIESKLKARLSLFAMFKPDDFIREFKKLPE
ncbi:hypothetical protein PX52LOC_03923 [Limnoglobus roseus]|uniref:Cytochrome c-552/4 domain-containing protein n=2 Tax=Limnoglobus roseus TaxID=2598579 RepID=A0A5C1AFP0_9BACT|nr:hypothetical protein PX52LOC_03923 [Limnoglobus roseus]